MKFGKYDVGVPRELSGGVQFCPQFPNGYGASIIRHRYSYGSRDGLWEVAVTRDGQLDSSTTVTDDVLGYLTESDVADVLLLIEHLPAVV